MNALAPNQFTRDYLSTWSEPDQDRRGDLIRGLWSSNGTLSVSSLGITLSGTDAIAAHISGVHDDLIAGKGLTFGYDQQVVSGETLLLRWSMRTPSGDIVGRGVDTVTFDGDGRIDSAHMFMGVE